MNALEQLAVIVPTVQGRERQLARCYGAYRLTAPEARIVTVPGFKTCGEAWNFGAALARETWADLRWLHFSADDLVPEPGWHAEALHFADRGTPPAPVLLNEDGSVWAGCEQPGSDAAFPRVPLLTVAQWDELGPVPPIHYYSDVWLGRRGWRFPVVASYCFRHTWAEPGRIHDSEPDRKAYEHAIASEAL